MPRQLIATSRKLPTPLKSTSEILADYEQWLLTQYGSVGTYRDHAKSFLKRYRDRGSLQSQLDTFAAKKSITGRSILNRFKRFLEEKNIVSAGNDLKPSRTATLPRANAYVKLYLAMSVDKLRSRKSLSTYATVLNRYFEFIGELRHFEKITAERFIFNKNFSLFTSALYATVLKSFARWAVGYLTSSDGELSPAERNIKHALSSMSVKSLRDILAIKTKAVSTKLYHKESLSKTQRGQLMKLCTIEEKAMVALMVYNGLRPIEVERLDVADVNFKKLVLSVHGKGRSQRSKEVIVLFNVVARSIRAHLKLTRIKKGKLFPGLTYKGLHERIQGLYKKMRLTKKDNGTPSFSPHSLRHTAGQLLYDEGVPLEFIQRTLRHTSMESTLVYARKAIERNYFKQMRHHW